MIKDRLLIVRSWMEKNHISALIIPSTDPHMSEYVADRWKVREWLSGFSGSAGTLVICMEKAGLWTDSRYFLQADAQLAGTGIDLYRQGLPGVPDYLEWLCSVLPAGDTVAADASLFTVEEESRMIESFSICGIKFLPLVDDPFDELWVDRPQIPMNKISIYPVEFSGEDSSEKMLRIRKYLKDNNAGSLFISRLDEIAWILNLRGNDIDYNPVFISYFLISLDRAILFVCKEKTDKSVCSYLDSIGVEVKDYEEIKNLSRFCTGNVVMDFSGNSAKIKYMFENTCLLHLPSPVSMMKAIRNNTEIMGLHNAMIKDGAALVRFVMWLEKAVQNGTETEYTIGEKLRYFRSCQKNFKGESFASIVGFRENGAVVHYEASQEKASEVEGEGLLLIDSGCQYLDGTTDITRTFAFGNISMEEKTDYTLVLKGHIKLAMACFPEGTRGTQLDVLARDAMWKSGINYLHGTGHGVGHFLNVHEGPQAIRMNDVPVPLKEGMVVSNEPGIYKSGRHGIRLENLMLVKEYCNGEFGRFLSFETVTLFPFDIKCIVVDMLTDDEKSWLNSYHSMVYERLQTMLSREERDWLADKTKHI